MLNVPRFDQVMCGSKDHDHAYWNCSECLSARSAAWSRRATKHHWQRLAHIMVRNAKRLGVLPLLDGSIACADCGNPAREYDHRDYGRPFDVEPVCHSCNTRRGPAKWPVIGDYSFALVVKAKPGKRARVA